MRRLLLVPLLSAVLFAAPPTHAQQQPDQREALLAELFTVMQFDKMFDPVMVQMRQVFEQRMRQVDPPLTDAEIQRVGDAVFTEIDAAMLPLMQQVAQIMLKYFSEEDMRAMLAYYRTPTGQKAIRVMPQMMAEIVPLQQQYMAQIGPRLKVRIEEALREMGYDL